jgi:hypothetical protein
MSAWRVAEAGKREEEGGTPLRCVAGVGYNRMRPRFVWDAPRIRLEPRHLPLGAYQRGESPTDTKMKGNSPSCAPRRVWAPSSPYVSLCLFQRGLSFVHLHAGCHDHIDAA